MKIKRSLENEFIRFFIDGYYFQLTIEAKKWIMKNFDKLIDISDIDDEIFNKYRLKKVHKNYSKVEV